MFLQVIYNSSGGGNSILIGTATIMFLSIAMVLLVGIHQRRVSAFNNKLARLESEKQVTILKANIQIQEEERNSIAADLHDDAGPLLATVRLYLTDNIINQDKAQQIQSIYNAKQIIDDAITLIRNISHGLMPPTLKNFGLENATVDLFKKINGSGVVKASARFHDYKVHLAPDKEMLVFRVIQELVNNTIKHSHAGFMHLTENINNGNYYIRIHHDGKGIIQSEYDRLCFEGAGLGLKNISSRIKVLGGKINFEIDDSKTFYKITLEIPNKNNL
ncbi:MAG: ATP-binding protein [Ferruginibacter sp.]|nr:two-component sensor histidine kinase [Ferruginibacter sp.]